jgi:protein SCO1/2
MHSARLTAAPSQRYGVRGTPPHPGMEFTASRPLRTLSHPAFWTLVLAAIIALPLARRAIGPSAPPLPVLGEVPAFHFIDENGAPFGPETLAGKPWVADFIFTRCPTVCPLMTERLAAVEPRLGERVHLVSLSVDPDFDTPERLRAFAAEHGARSARWHFLTGDSAAVQRAVTDGFKISLSHEGPDDDFLSIVHGVHAVLIDAQGRIRGYYDSTDPEALDRLVRDVHRLDG